MRLIDADALLDTLQELFDKREREAKFTGDRNVMVTWNDAIYQIKTAPTIEPKKGKWIHVDRKKAYDRFCSECQKKCWYVGIGDYAFCPNCGADMRQREE